MDVETQMIEVPAAGGAMPAFRVRPKSGARAPGVLVIQEAFGLNEHIKDVARRIAGEGYVALAPDLYWRGGKGRTVGYDQLPEAIGLMQSLKGPEVVSDVASGIAYLEKQSFVRADRIGITGFCMGGRVAYLAACELAEEVLRGLEAAGDTIAAVLCPPDAGPKPDPVKAAALARGIPVHQFRSLRAPEARHAFDAARADLGVLAYATQIVPEPLLHVPRLTSICFHPSLLPRYRGGSAIAWQLIRGETES